MGPTLFAAVISVAVSAPSRPAPAEGGERAPDPPPRARAGARSDAARREARALIERAIRAYRAGKLVDAGELYLEAHRVVADGGLTEKPELLYNAALAFDEAGLCDRAAELYDRFLLARPEALQNERALARRVQDARACAPEVRVESAPPGASVSIDGAPRGTAPVLLRLRAGRHQLALVLAGHEGAEETFVVQAGQPLRVERALGRLTPPATRDEALAGSSATKLGAAPALPPRPAPPLGETGVQVPAFAPASGPPALTWAGGAVGVAALGLGIVARVLSAAAVDRYESELERQLRLPSAERSSAGVREDEALAVRWEVVSNASLGAAALGAAVAVTAWLLDEQEPNPGAAGDRPGGVGSAERSTIEGARSRGDSRAADVEWSGAVEAGGRAASLGAGVVISW